MLPHPTPPFPEALPSKVFDNLQKIWAAVTTNSMCPTYTLGFEDHP